MLSRATRSLLPRLVSSRQFWSDVTAAPADPILGLVAQFKLDEAHPKVNLAQGAYRTEEGAPLVLDVVRKAEAKVAADTTLNKEYLGVEGNPEFLALSRAFVLGNDSAAIAAGRVTTVQTLSGTGALRVAADFLKKFAPTDEIYISNPSWGNHAKVFGAAGLQVKHYAYLDQEGVALDFGAMLADLKAIPKGACVLLHACAHNPTGVDPTMAQWEELAEVVKANGLLPLFDSAYQGYASGDPEADAASVRAFEKAGINSLICQSFAKNMGLYGERVGALNVMCADAEEAANVKSQLMTTVIRPNYSSPPLHGSRLAAMVLGDTELRAEWMVELQGMSGRIHSMRAQLRSEIEAVGCPGDWNHITDQIGMFAYTGLSQAAVQRLLDEYHIYLTKDGRMSIAGLTGKDIPYVAKAIKAVLT